MLKCDVCGSANDDGQKFCSECGNKLVADAQPDIGETAADAPSEKVCPACGAKNGADENFCSECGKPLNDVQAVKPQPSEKGAEKVYKKNLGGIAERVKDKTMAFENKHHVIANAFVAALSLVFILVALLAPVKYTMYGFNPSSMMSATNMSTSDYDYDFDDMFGEDAEEDIVERVAYLAVNQSVFNALSAAPALMLDFNNSSDVQKYQDYMKEYADALLKGAADWLEWTAKHLDTIQDWDEQKLIDKATEFFAKPLSKVNVMRVQAASLSYRLFTISQSSGSSDGSVEAAILAEMYNLAMTLIFNLIILILSVVIAIVSLTYLIKAIIGIVKKTPTNNGLFKLIFTAMSLAASCIALACVAPELKIGGGMFAIMLVGAIVAIVCGAVSSFVNKVHKPFDVFKNAGIGIVLTVAFFLLCTDIITVKATNGSVGSETTYGPLGYAMYMAFSSLLNSFAGSSGELIGVFVSGVIVCVLLMIAVSLFGKGVASRLRYNACGIVTKKNGTTVKNAYGTGSLIGGLVVGFIGAIFALAGSPALYEVFAESSKFVVSFGVRAQVFVSFALTLVALIVSSVLSTDKFGKNKLNGQSGDTTAGTAAV